MSGGINKVASGGNAVGINAQTDSAQQTQSSRLTKTSTQASGVKINNQQPLSPKEIKRIINKINENVSRLNKDVRFAYNDTIKSLVVKVIDAKTGRVIREIPPQQVINLQKKLSEVVGIIFDSKEVEK